MKKVVVANPGGYDRLKIQEFEEPEPKAGEVLIETKACGVNFADCCVRMGVYSSANEFVGWPITPGFEVSGIIKEVGKGVSSFSKGQRVIGITFFNGYTTHLTLPENQVFHLPETLTFEQGASISVVFLTAYYALFVLAHPRPLETMLVHSAAGGVGSSLVQLGQLADCQVIGVVGSSHKVAWVKELGASQVIDKSCENLWQKVEQMASLGIEMIFDANGVETLKQSYKHTKPGGRLVIYGFHTMFSKGRGKPNWLKMAWDYLRTPRFNPLQMTNDNRSVLAFNLSYLFNKNQELYQAILKILNWFQEGKLKVPICKSYPLEEVKEAHRELESGQTIGKLVLTN